MRLLGAVLLVCCIAQPARADDLSDAKAHYELGASAYEKGDFAGAIRDFEASYALSKKPEILWNLARAAEKLQDGQRAIDYLNAYLAAAPDAPDVPAVRAEIEALQRSLTDEKAKTDAQADAAQAKAEAALAQRQAEASRIAAAKAGVRPRWPGYAAIAVGAAILGTGIALGVVAESAASKARGGTATTGTAGRFDLSVQSQGKLASGLGIAFDVVGGVLAAGGVGWILWARQGERGDEKKVSIAPVPGGLVVGGAW